MNIISKAFLKVVAAAFALGFFIGGVVCVIGFTLVVDLMAGR